MNENQAGGIAPTLAELPGKCRVVLADVDGRLAVYSANGFDVHRMSPGTGITNCDVAHLRVAVGRDTGGPSIVIPLVGVAAAAPVRHVASGTPDFPGRIANAFAVVHTPAVDNDVLRSIGPHRRIADVVGVALHIV